MVDVPPTMPGAGIAAVRPLTAARRNLFPPLQNPTLARASGALAENRPDLAQPLVAGFLNEHPNDTDALNLMADLARRADRPEIAEQLLARCIEQSDGPGYGFNYAVILLRLNKLQEALAQLDRLLATHPANPLFCDQKAKVLHELGNHVDALACRRQLANQYPASPEVWLAYGDSLRLAGHVDRCVPAYRKAQTLAPRMTAIYPRLANLRGYRFTADDIGWLEKQLAVADLPADTRAHLHFVLGNAYADQKQPAKSFEHYEKGNALQRLDDEPNPEQLSALRRTCEALFTESFFRERVDFGTDSAAPIFLVGMPRAGSTLVEQILSAHSAIEGLGELPDFMATVQQLFDGLEAEELSQVYVQALGRLTSATSRSLGEMYLQRTARRRKLGRPFFTDKSGANFTNIGLIQLTLPNAKIIDVRRHPLDCGWSCFRSHFPGGQPFSHDLGDIGRHYSDYVRLMAHFDRVLPGRIYCVLYEDLIENPESEIRRLLDHLGLPFEEQCLRFHEIKRTVRTLSGDQVRQPLYKGGTDQWRPYEPWLGPLERALGPVLESYPQPPN